MAQAVAAASRDAPVAAQQHGVVATGGDLGVDDALARLWDVALAEAVGAASHDAAVTPEEHCVGASSEPVSRAERSSVREAVRGGGATRVRPSHRRRRRAPFGRPTERDDADR